MKNTVATHFGLGMSQAQLDFVDVPLDEDLRLFVDPFAVSRAGGPFFESCNGLLTSFFQEVLDRIRTGQEGGARKLLDHLHEPNETHLGLSAAAPRGAGIGARHAVDIYDALEKSTAAATGYIDQIAECELWVRNVGHDKISDLTTNIIRGELAKYTRAQCDLHGIPTTTIALPGHVYNPVAAEWKGQYGNLPLYQDAPLLLVPKLIVRRHPGFDHTNYHRHYVLNYLQAEHNAPHKSLEEALRGPSYGKVSKKQLEAQFPADKEWLLEWTKSHKEVFDHYRRDRPDEVDGTPFDHAVDAEKLLASVATTLVAALRDVPPGVKSATAYHRLMASALELVFYPQLIYPRLEWEINDGRKRIDIVFENNAKDGVFKRLIDAWRVPAAKVIFECKNYSDDLANPEWDQLLGRFNDRVVEVGFICCRKLENRELGLKRCQDAFQQGRGLIMPLDDTTVITLLQFAALRDPKGIDEAISALVQEVAGR